jgi:hypothetical protein
MRKTRIGRKKRKWISGAVRHPGALHRALGVPEGSRIPEHVLREASHAPGPVGREARLALTLAEFAGRETEATRRRAGKRAWQTRVESESHAELERELRSAARKAARTRARRKGSGR